MGSFKSLILMAVVCAQLQLIAAMTNYEFYQALKPYIDDDQVEYTEMVEGDDDDFNDDVIRIPGEPNDELDVEYLVGKMGLVDEGNNDSDEINLNLPDRLGVSGKCRCKKLSCECCVKHRFSFKIFWHRVKFTLRGCMTVGYRNGKFSLKFSLNKKTMFRKNINFKRLKFCYKVPGLRVASVCLELYGINIAKKQICAKLVGKLDIKIKKFKVNWKLGCVRIPMLKKFEGLYLGRDSSEEYLANDDDEDLAENDDTLRYEANDVDTSSEDVDMSSDDVTKPEDTLISLFMAELGKSLDNQ